MIRMNAALCGLMILILVGLAAALVDGCAHKAEVAQKYHCPMHPTYVADRLGDCPICGMKVVPIAAEAGTGAADADGAMGDMRGTVAEHGGPRRILYYRNPMDSSITSPTPRKDAMGMDYLPVYSDEPSGKRGVEGYATVRAGAEEIQKAGLQVATAARGTLARAARAVGEVKADEARVRQVSLKSSGWVEKLFVNSSGQRVAKGEPLLSIYSPELLATEREFLDAAAAAAKFAGSDLPEVRSGGADLLEAARRRLQLFDVSEAFITELARTKRPVRAIVLEAPASGFVTTKDVYEGSRVEPGMPLYSVTDLSRVWIEADLYEFEAAAIKVGQEARITLASDTGPALMGRVTTILPYLNSETRTLRVRFEVGNPGYRLKPGMYASVELAVESAEGVIVPETAVMDTGTRQLVFVETTPGQFVPRVVAVGLRASGNALLRSGVKEGERVVATSTFLLDSESRIQAAIAGAGSADTMGGGAR